MNKKIATIFLVVAILIMLYFTYPPFTNLFKTSPPTPNVKFYDYPTLSEPSVNVHRSTILTFTVRNDDNIPVNNVTAVLSVTQGLNSDSDLQFNKITKISDKITPGDISDKINIPIHTIDMSGTSSQFHLKLEVQVNGVPTTSSDIVLTIVP